MNLSPIGSKVLTAWLPASIEGPKNTTIDSSNVKARLVEYELVDEEGESLNKTQIVVEHKVSGNDAMHPDLSLDAVKPHTDDYKKLKKRFKNVFEAYETAQSKIHDAMIDELDLSPTAKTRLIKSGVNTIKDLAGLKDEDLNEFGPGSVEWRKKAQQFLAQ